MDVFHFVPICRIWAWCTYTMVGIGKLEGKDKRRERSRNHIAKDLKTDKYHQRVVPDGRRKKYIYVNGDHEDEHFFEEVYYDDDQQT